MQSFFKELFQYSHHYNQQLADIFINHPEKTAGTALKLFSHILNAHHVWNNRVGGQQVRFGVWEVHSADKLKGIDDENYDQSLVILDKFDLNQVIDYKTSRGEPFSNSIRDILFHVINHSTYHRAQIATEFRQNGLAPIATDFVFYKR